ncbi:MAG: recombinase family protein [Candidatus Thermoplasmatota archaeon]|nr:recombinase family protein [Candidatus Thermoplasmatota archaeon]
MKRVAVYVRVSTLEQAENGWSVQGQYSECRSFVENMADAGVVRVYRDAGVSGSTVEREGLQMLLYHASCELFDVVVVWKYDRLSRSNTDFPAIMHYLTSRDIEVLSVKEPVGSYDNPTSELMIGLLGLMSTFERKTFAMRSKMGKLSRAKQGLWHGGTPPFGYRYNRDTGRLDIKSEEAEIIRVMFKRFVDEPSLRGLARHLNINGLKTQKGKNWDAQLVKNVLTNCVLKGDIRFKEVLYHDERLRIIDDESFELVQKWLVLGAVPPFGYMWDKETGQLAVNEEEAVVVRLCFYKFLEFNADIPAVISWMKRKGYNLRDGHWYKTRLHFVLNKPVYVGYYMMGPKVEYRKELAIVDDETFDMVQELGQKYYKFFRDHRITTVEMRADKLRSNEYRIHTNECDLKKKGERWPGVG